MDHLRLANGHLSLALDLGGGAVKEFSANTASGPFPLFFRGGSRGPVCFPLVPFGNRLRDNGFTFERHAYHLPANTHGDPLYLHGDGWLSDWSIAYVSESEAVLTFAQSDRRLPYCYKAEQRFCLDGLSLRISLSVINMGPLRMPFGLGLHPFLPLTPETKLAFQAGAFWEQDNAFLPTRRLPVSGELDFAQGKVVPRRWMNTEFEGWTGTARIDWPETGTALEIATRPALSRCMVFVSSTEFDPSYTRDWFCFEPMTHGVDAHHRRDGGLRPLGTGEKISVEAIFTHKLALGVDEAI